MTSSTFAILAAVVAIVLSWAAYMRGHRAGRASVPPASVVPTPASTTAPVVDVAVAAGQERLARDLGQLENAAESPTPATDVSDLVNLRARRPKDIQ